MGSPFLSAEGQGKLEFLSALVLDVYENVFEALYILLPGIIGAHQACLGGDGMDVHVRKLVCGVIGLVKVV